MPRARSLAFNTVGLRPFEEGCRLPVLPGICSQRFKGLPGSWVVLLFVAVVTHLAGCDVPSPFIAVTITMADTRQMKTLGTPDGFISRLDSHGPSLACLRINEHLTVNAARLATSLPGLALAGRDSHPLDNISEFHKVIAYFNPFRPEFPGRNSSFNAA